MRLAIAVAAGGSMLAACRGNVPIAPYTSADSYLAAPNVSPRRNEFPPTPSGVHLNLVFNYLVRDLHREIGLIDVVWGSRSPYPTQVVNQSYTPFERDDPFGPNHSLQWWKRHHPDWIEYRCNRKSVAFEFDEPNVPFDIANPAVRAYQQSASVDPALAEGYRGIDFDNLELGNYWHRCGHFSTDGKWMQQYSGADSDPRYTRDVLAWAQSTFAYIHRYSPTATMSINFSYDSNFSMDENDALATQTDELLDEGGFTNYGSKGHNVTTPQEWRRIVGMIRWVQANGGCYMENGEEAALSKDITQPERLWVVANYLLNRDDCTYVWMSGFTQSGQQDYGRILLYPEYKLAVGKPTGAAQQSGNAWKRPYSGGLALVNPSEQGVIVPLHGDYVDENGKKYSGSIQLAKTSGQILLKR
ncbi:MAG: hypothetical protein JO113_04350 [Candidatus Eremiobacteraeota bacterium]|nr:hypothetical protein [Candidatus Eremiobacteraeota bacterium]